MVIQDLLHLEQAAHDSALPAAEDRGDVRAARLRESEGAVEREREYASERGG